MTQRYILSEVEPKSLLRYFEEISAIPRGSGNEKGIADYLEGFAKNHGLYCMRDRYNNIFIKKPATNGKEDSPAILLQGHVDMVCEKSSDSAHDFLTDPLKLSFDGEWLSAEGTSLGGDDGVAVAAMLAVLDPENAVEHPALECLFTVDEEVGMIGASSFDYSEVSAGMLINLDSEDEGVVIIGCAGSSSSVLSYSYDTVPLYGKCIEVSLGGLIGGHSGNDIDKERKNSIKFLVRILSAFYDESPFNLVTISGGDKDNAIPREAKAIIAVTDPDEAGERIKEIFNSFRGELVADDAGCRVYVNKAKSADISDGKMFSYKSTSTVLSMITLSPSGVWSRDVKNNMVEASTNLSSVRVGGGAVTIPFMNRSSRESRLHEIENQISKVARVTGADYRQTDSYPGWQPEYDTKLQKLYAECYSELYPEAQPARFMQIHAGLECGIIGGGLRAVKGSDFAFDAISIGPEMRDIHSPNERLCIPSVERFWHILLAILKKI